MDIQVKPGKYVVAVSGGVDSVVLLHLLQAVPDVELIVAHFDHGTRPDSKKDRIFVEALAGQGNLPFTYEEGHLGPAASEAAARKARYAFLRRIKDKNGAGAIIMAHHEDDVLETAIINLLRGTNRKGLSALQDRDDLLRPVLHAKKSDLTDYARRHGLQWREDSTNQDETYLRNYVRRQILPRFDDSDKKRLLAIIHKGKTLNQAVDSLLVTPMAPAGDTFGRQHFIDLPHEVAREAMAAWLRANKLRDFDSKTLERLTIAGKVAQPGTQFDVLRAVKLKVGEDILALIDTER